MQRFLNSNDTRYRLARTILQGVVGVIIAYLDVLIGVLTIPNELRPFIVALVMAILSPIMSELGVATDSDDDDIYEECEDEEDMDEEGDEDGITD